MEFSVFSWKEVSKTGRTLFFLEFFEEGDSRERCWCWRKMLLTWRLKREELFRIRVLHLWERIAFLRKRRVFDLSIGLSKEPIFGLELIAYAR